MTEYLPEGLLINTSDNQNSIRTIGGLKDAFKNGKILESLCVVCDKDHNLVVDFGFMKGIIPRDEGAIGIDDGSTRDIALISRVGKSICFRITSFSVDSEGNEIALLSRKNVQLECMNNYTSKMTPGDIITAKVTHLEQFGCFVDIGCGIPSLIPIDAISISRISHPRDRFYIGQNIYAVVKSNEGGRVSLTHKELLGSWEENADNFKVGETVTGIIRSIEGYGIFVELAPNLAGLAESRPDVSVNRHVSVYIKAVIPEKMKIKLIIVDTFDDDYINHKLNYYKTFGHIDEWIYSSAGSEKYIGTNFKY